MPLVFEQLFWIEAVHGRIPQAIWALEMTSATVRQIIDMEEEDRQNWHERVRIQDGILSMLLLKADRDQLSRVRALLPWFEELGLYACATALRFSFGGPAALRQHEYVAADGADDAVWDVMKALWSQPAQAGLPRTIETMEGETITMKSYVLGTRWEVTCSNRTVPVRVAKSFLGFLESFLVTAIRHQVAPIKEVVHVSFVTTDHVESRQSDTGISHLISDTRPHLTIEIEEASFPAAGLFTDQIRGQFAEILCGMLPKVIIPQEVKTFFETVVEEEGAFPRSMLFADVLASSSNVFDDCASPKLDDRVVNADLVEITADPPCNIALQTIMALREPAAEPMMFGTGEAAAISSPTRHRGQGVRSKVNIELWSQAGWTGILVAQLGNLPPALGVMFRDRDQGGAIFREWIADIQEPEDADDIRVVVVTGVDRKFPSSYKVLIGSKLDRSKANDYMFMITKICPVDNPNPANLQSFRREYQQYGAYYLMPVCFTPGDPEPDLLTELGFLKRELEFKEAWTIGLNDPDSVCIRLDQEPVIPDDEQDAPVLKVLERLKRRRDELGPDMHG